MSRKQVLTWDLQIKGKTFTPDKLKKPAAMEETLDALDGNIKYKISTGIVGIAEAEITVGITEDLADYKFMQDLVENRTVSDVFAVGRSRGGKIILKWLWEECEFIEGENSDSDNSSPAAESKMYKALPKNITRIV